MSKSTLSTQPPPRNSPRFGFSSISTSLGTLTLIATGSADFFMSLPTQFAIHSILPYASRKRARWDLNPGSPAPQASVLIQPRLRAPSARLLYSCNINADVKGKIINTLVKPKNNVLEEQTVKIVGFYLNQFCRS